VERAVQVRRAVDQDERAGVDHRSVAWVARRAGMAAAGGRCRGAWPCRSRVPPPVSQRRGSSDWVGFRSVLTRSRADPLSSCPASAWSQVCRAFRAVSAAVP
jgi:hypothetical protein